MHLGFIGTGNIATAIITGLCTCDPPASTIWVSPRNKQKADALAAQWPAVHVGTSNQAVLDHSDMVFLAILPQQKEKILSDLRFRKNQIIVHLLAGTPVEKIQPLIQPADQIVRAVPLPSTAIHAGPIVIYPDQGDAVSRAGDLFSRIGKLIAVRQEDHLETLAVITSLMAPYYAFVEAATAWGKAQGIERKDAAAYTASMFGALSRIAESEDRGDIPSLVAQSMTPGGLNELAMKVIEQHGEFSPITAALDAVKNRQ
jgi:pyrroline-5-carboxylate reductase